ncbi:MAG: type II toxin-antitoxin system HicB family antitoxin [Patescibacteria group bacterium]
MAKRPKKIKKEILNFNAVFLEEPEGGYSVSVPVFPGCFSQGDSFEEAVKNIQEAIELYLEDDKSAERQKKFSLYPIIKR